MRRVLPFILPLTLLASLAACDSATAPTIEETRFAGHLGVDLAAMTRLPSGVYVRDLVLGDGAVAENGSTVAVHYRGWLPDGTPFDQRQGADPPFSFVLGSPQVIAGWNVGVRGMRVGGRRQLVIPPALAYGSTPHGSIPANSILVFEVTLLGVQ
jgi:FKBP-type peptidyl-prolyl cis-trans isomerase FkpA